MPEPLIKDASTVLEAFFALLIKKDHNGMFKMFSPSGALTDLEGNSLRAGQINGFFRDWPPRSMLIKIGKHQINGQSALSSLTLTGGGFSKPADAKFHFLFDEKYFIKSLRIQIGG